MEKPYSLEKHPFMDQNEKDKFLDFMLDWAAFYQSVEWGHIHISAIVEKTGLSKKQFDDLLFLHKNQSIYDAIRKSWIYGKRAMTIREICSILGTKFSETNIRKQVNKLSRNGYLKCLKVKVFDKTVEFYYISKNQVND